MRRRTVLGLAAGLVLVLGIDGSATSDAPIKSNAASLIGSIRLKSPDPLFGGFSAVAIGLNGSSIVALSDRGIFVQGRVVRDASDIMTSVTLGPLTRLLGVSGDVLTGQFDDSEGLAVAPNGEVFVAFEDKTRISRFSRLGAVPVDLPNYPAFAHLPKNQSLEALAIDAKGTLYAVPEVPLGKQIPVYRFRNGKWREPLALPRIGPFNPVAADFGPDGKLYLLERRFNGLTGFATRLRRFDLRADGFSKGEILLQTPVGRHDNLEGLSIWRAPDGLRATMMSDDNFFALQVTELVEYRLPD